MKILILDDDITFLSLYQKVLEKHLLPGDEVFVSADAPHCAEIIKQRGIELVITDLIMPTKSGLDILREVKEISPLIEVIVVTGQGSIDSAVKAMQFGARDYLTKPINQGMLIEKIQNIREFISRIHEVEEYRIAKETVEDNATHIVSDMEIKVSRYMLAFKKIGSIIELEKDPTAKLSEISNVIVNFDKDH